MGEIWGPPCRGAGYGTDLSGLPHGDHPYYAHRNSHPGTCPGWSPEEFTAAAMVRQVDMMLTPYACGEMLPPGMALLIHPALYGALARVHMPSYAQFLGGDPLSRVPVTVDPALPYGTWRLVLAQGGVPVLVMVKDRAAGGPMDTSVREPG